MQTYKKFIFEDFPSEKVVNRSEEDKQTNSLNNQEKNIVNKAIREQMNIIAGDDQEDGQEQKQESVQVKDKQHNDNVSKAKKNPSQPAQGSRDIKAETEDSFNIEEIKQKARLEGFKEAEEKYKPELEKAQDVQSIISKICQKLETLNFTADLDQQLQNSVIDIIKITLDKLYKNLPSEVEKFIENELLELCQQYRENKKIQIFVSPQMQQKYLDILKEKLPENLLAIVAVDVDDKLSEYDCNVALGDSVFSYHRTEILNKLNDILQLNQTEKGEDHE